MILVNGVAWYDEHGIVIFVVQIAVIIFPLKIITSPTLGKMLELLKMIINCFGEFHWHNVSLTPGNDNNILQLNDDDDDDDVIIWLTLFVNLLKVIIICVPSFEYFVDKIVGASGFARILWIEMVTLNPK